MQVVTLCGSMRFAKQMQQIAVALETKQGYCVLQPVFDVDVTLNEQDIANLSKAHFKKIDLSDIVYIVNVGGYIGKSVTEELQYAKLQNKKIIYHSEVICELSDIRLKGIHNYENVMCAILIAKQFNVSNDSIKEALNRFAGVEHRMEFVRRFENREFYNDSKATNNASTITALSAFDTPVILLLGGLDRGLPYDELAEHMKYVKAVVCYGETKDKIEEFCNRINVSVTKVDNLEEATKFAYNISEEGDTILLSPAHASWDQFKSFEERGEKFKEIINNLQ